MRVFIVEGTRLDIDDKTAIGITHQAYSVSEPATRLVSATNSFSIPATAKNLAKFGHPSNMSVLTPDVYVSKIASYYINSQGVVNNAKVRVDKVYKGRIYLTLFEKSDIWDTLKGVLWSDFLPNYLIWLNTNYNIPIESSPMWYTILDESGLYVPNSEFPLLLDRIDASGAIKLSKYFTPFIENVGTYYTWDAITLDDNEATQHINGGNFSTFIKPIFEYIEDTYNVSFYTGDATVSGNIFFDTFANSIYTPLRTLKFARKSQGSDVGQYLAIESDPYYYKVGAIESLAGKTLFDMIDAYMKLMNVAISSHTTAAGIEGYHLVRFDEIDQNTALNWTGKIESMNDISHSFFISGASQNNYIKFSKIYESGSDLYNSKNIVCNNTSLPYSRDLVTINAFAANVITAENPTVSGSFSTYLNLTKEESFTDFIFLTDDNLITDHKVEVYDDEYFVTPHMSALRDIYKAALVGIGSEYMLLESVYAYPIVLSLNLWLTAVDMYNFNPSRPVWFKELGGVFFINKISGFNPEMSTRATKVELIKLSNKVPTGAL